MKRVINLLILCVFIFVGCNKDTPKNETQVTIYLSTGTMTNTETKSATDDENRISELVLYGVDDKQAVVKIFPVITNPSSSISQPVPVEVKTLYAIANPTAEIKSATPSNVSDLLNLTANFAAPPQSPFIMGGKGNIAAASANIELIRAVAKVEIIAENGLEIESLTVKNTPNRGYVFKKETLASPTASAMINYSTVNSTNPVVYVAENSKNDPTEFAIKGKYLDKDVNYTIVIKKNGVPLDIARNTCYKVYISATPDLECTVAISITDWVDEEDIDDHIIPDIAFES